MSRKKTRFVSVEVVEPNSYWDYTKLKNLNNFVCKTDDVEEVIHDMDSGEHYETEEEYQDEVKAILARPGTRNASVSFFGDDVSVEEFKLPASIKPGTEYIYKIYDYCGGKTNVGYGTRKEIITHISKVVKTKYVYVTHNGNSEKTEYSAKMISDTLDELEKTTSQLEIEPVGRSGMTDDMILVTAFRNCIKK